MDRHRFDDIQRLYHRVRAASPSERAEILQEECGADSELRAEVESLLASSGEGFLETPAWQLTPLTEGLEDQGADVDLPERIGAYRIRARLGEGGMGIVFLAEQESTGRDVALKIIRPGFSSAEARARFAREAKLLARLRHPGIARIFEAGVHGEGEAALPYIAMERARGPSLLDYVRDRDLGEREIIESFLPVCEAIEHAHRQGVVHRDLKPGNILVDLAGESPQPMVLDFGIARALDSTAATSLRTRPDQIVGTVRYMSPEQARGLEVDARADVYALGVILYELLAGQPPHALESRSLPEALRIVSEEDVTPLPQGAHRSSDLVTIAGKALENDPSRRYSSAGELAADLRRFLNHEVIQARPPSTWYRLQKLARRHRVLVASLASVFVILVAATIVATSFALSERRQRGRLEQALKAEALALADAQRDRDVARQQQEAAEAAREQADASRREAELQMETTQEVNDFLNRDLLGAADPHQTRDRELTARELLDRAAEKLEGRFADRPLVEAALRNTLGTAYSGLGRYDLAEPHLDRLLELTRRHRGEDHPDTVRALASVAVNLDRQGRYADAEPLHRRALEIRRQTLGEDHPKTLDAASNLGAWFFYRGRLDEALPLWTSVLERRRELEGQESSGTLNAMVNLAYLYVVLGRLEEAEPMYRHALEVRERTLGEEHPATLRVRVNLAGLLDQAGRHEESAAELEKIVAVQRRTLGSEHPDTLLSLNNHASVLKRLERHEEAERIYREVLERRRGSLGDRHPDTLLSINNLAVLLFGQRRYDESAALFEEAMQGMRATLGAGHPSTVSVTGNHSDALWNAGRRAEALALLEQAGELAADDADASAGAGRELIFRKARLLIRRGSHAEAEPLLVDLKQSIEEDASGSGTLLRLILLELADLYEATDRPEEAAACRESAGGQ